MNEQTHAQLVANQIPEFLHLMEVSLRSGYNVSQCLEIAVKDMSGPMTTEVQLVLAEAKAGVPLLQAFDNWLSRCPSLDLDLTVATIHEQMEAGGNLANKFQFVAQVLPKLKRVG
ncbi:MAG: hypothetical protein HC804_00035 [Anaerolineae bacterium]|nr:hypothetical protein [Anaerolineae bacterium]